MEQRQIIHVPFSAGLDTKADPRALEAPMLSICKDAEFDAVGGLVTRKPYTNLGVNILGGGTISNPRKLVANGAELVLFTDTAVYSWDGKDSAWVSRGTHLAVSLQETTRFQTTDDQAMCDRAELGNVIFVCWRAGYLPITANLYVAAIDKTNGAVIAGPTAIGAHGCRPRLVALQTRVAFFYDDGTESTPGNIKCLMLDPANVASSLAGSATTILAAANANQYFDVTQVIGADQAVGAIRRAVTTSYTLFTITAGASLATTTYAHTADGPIGVSCTPDGLKVQVVRANSNNINGDLFNISGLTNVNADTAIVSALGSNASNIACAHQTTLQGGQYRCYIFASTGESPTNSNFLSITTWIDTAAAIATATQFVPGTCPATRAFAYGGRVYVWMAFGQTSQGVGTGLQAVVGQFQNSYFLYRDDAFLCAKACSNRGAGLTSGGSNGETGRLPGVALTSGSTSFSCCLSIRRRVPIGTGTAAGALQAASGFAMRAPQDVTFTFDSNDARRTARIGSTLYIAAGEILQYDGNGVYEVGFHVAPWYMHGQAVGGGAQNQANGTYGYKQSWRWQNAQGEIDRSTGSIVANMLQGAGPTAYTNWDTFDPLTITHKTANQPAIEWWCTAANPTADGPFYLVSNPDPSHNGDTYNAYVANTYVPLAAVAAAIVLANFNDGYADATRTTLQTSPENGGILQNIAPPAATLIAATDTRMFLSGIAHDPDVVWYSKLRGAGEVASFNDALTIAVPKVGGKITALAFLNETLIVFRERAIYAFPGDGYDNLGGGSNYGPARILSLEAGAVAQESVALVDAGLLFKSSRGWFVLNRGWSVSYFGKGAAAYDAEAPVATQVVGGQQQVRIATGNRVLIWDSLVKEWGEWTISGALDATVWNGTYLYLTSAGVFQQGADFSAGTNYGMDVELAWLKPVGYTGRFNVRWIQPLGEFRSAFTPRIRVARNYRSDGAGNPEYFNDRVKTTATVVGGPMQVRHGPSIQIGYEAIKVRITATGTIATIAITSGGATMTLTAKKAGTLGNALALAGSVTSQAVPSVADSGGNTITLSGQASPAGTFQQVIDAVNFGSQLVSAALTGGSAGAAFPLASFVGSLSGGLDWPTGEAMRLTGVGFEIGSAPGLFKLLAQAQEG